MRRLLHTLPKTRTALLSLVVLLSFCIMAIGASALAPCDPHQIALEKRLIPPAWMSGGTSAHLLGTDSLGRDILSRLVYGARISIVVGLSAVSMSSCLGVMLGMVTGYYGGWIDKVLMRLADIQLAFPSIILYIAVMAILGSGLLHIIMVLGITGWVVYGRLVRGQVISCREEEFVEAARALGATNSRIMTHHIFPNITAPIIIIATTSVAGNILAEASLSFLGLGVPPSVPSWGSMLAEGREYVRIAWWLPVFPGLAIMLMVLAINIVGDWLRDYLDPRLEL